MPNERCSPASISPFGCLPPASLTRGIDPCPSELERAWPHKACSPSGQRPFCPRAFIVTDVSLRSRQQPGTAPGAGLSAHKQSVIPRPSSAPACQLPSPTPRLQPHAVHTLTPPTRLPAMCSSLVCLGTVITLGFPAWPSRPRLWAWAPQRV